MGRCNPSSFNAFVIEETQASSSSIDRRPPALTHINLTLPPAEGREGGELPLLFCPPQEVRTRVRRNCRGDMQFAQFGQRIGSEGCKEGGKTSLSEVVRFKV
mmetsp:Transcript_40297/g.79467  ORF Transcript_40297/g.79467 Transcript_40297/m.79467 type:complete len:102 (+) Transcript_40297:84-389(+)